MAKGKKSKSRKSKKGTPRGKSVKIGARSYKCYAKRVRTGRGKKKTTRAFCRKP